MSRQTLTTHADPTMARHPRNPASRPAAASRPLGQRRRGIRPEDRMTRVFRTLGGGLVTQYGLR
jgi:hypothetical protein